MIHKDFVYWKEVAINLLCNEEEQLRELRRNQYNFSTMATTSNIMVAIMFLNYDNHYVNAMPSYIIIRYTGLTLFSHVIFAPDIYFVVDEKYNTCHYSSSNSNGVNYFAADKKTREMIMMEKRLFNV